jgi:Flp pilus assembly protein TadD
MAAAAATMREEAARFMRARDWGGAIGWIDRALASSPRDAELLLTRAHCLLALGRSKDACAAAGEALHSTDDAKRLDAIGTFLNRANEQPQALVAFDRAVALAPDNPHFLFNRATLQRFLGHLAAAEADYDRVIALRPNDYEAYKNRSDLRTQSAERNHIAELRAVAARASLDWKADVQIQYALAKEYEDIGDYARSFQHLQSGAGTRRRHLRYDVAADVATVDWIIEAFAAAREPLRAPATAPGDAPIFIVGLPRSGTTLVDRILGSHSTLFSAGELTCFALSIVDAVRQQSGAAALTRRHLIAHSATLDFSALGHEYLKRARATIPAGMRFTDKMPLNFLYCGLILRSLPNAKIVHVTRRPMAACYAMYKTLFEDGYPFSYDLTEIGGYYLGYRRLMEHWQAALPGCIHHVSYESLVADQAMETRRLLDFCGLEWQQACAEFHRNSAPTTTASAAQVRRPLYDSSVSQWRYYAAELAPLSALLAAAGIDTEHA